MPTNMTIFKYPKY